MKILFFFFAVLFQVSVHAQATATKHKEWLGILSLTEKYKEDKNWAKADEAIVGEHFQRLVKMKNEGIVVLAGRTNLPTNSPDMMGLVIFYAQDEKEALQFMLDDPAVKNKIMTMKVLPYAIAINKCN